MPLSVSLVVAATSAAKAHGLIASVDTQSLGTDQFELVVLDAGLDEESRTSLDRLVERRPNVSVLDPAGDWLGQLRGDYVLVLDERLQLFPESVERLLGHAREHQLDVVAGRVVQPGQAVPAAFLADAGADASHRETLLAAPVTLVRRERAAVIAGSGRPEVRAADDDVSVGVFSSYPVGLRAEPSSRTGVLASAEAPTLSWSGPDLVLTASGTVEGGGEAALVAGLSLRHLDTELSYLIPAEASVDNHADESSSESSGAAGPARRGWRLSATINPLTVAGGSRLPRGQYQVEVLLGGDSVGADPRPLPGAAAPPAFFDDFVFVATDGPQGLLHLDVEASKSSITGILPPSAATVTETAAGSLLRVTLPDANVQTTRTHAGHIGLNKFQLPATWETASGQAVLTAYLSGLAGSYTLVAKCGKSPFRNTGLTVVMAGSGEMQIITTPPAPKPAAPAPAAAAPAKPKSAKPKSTSAAKARRRKRKPVAQGPVATLRRALPKSLEPGIRRLRQQPLARALYRKATGLAKSGSR